MAAEAMSGMCSCLLLAAWSEILLYMAAHAGCVGCVIL